MNPDLKLIYAKSSNLYYDRDFQDPDFKRLQKGEFITVFFFNKDTIDNNDWNYIRKNNKYLKIYEFRKNSPFQIFYP